MFSSNTSLISATVALLLSTTLVAQDSKLPAVEDDTIILSPFVIKGEQSGRYQPTETMIGGRTRGTLFEAPQSVSVVTRELIDDVGAGRLLDALQYISGVTESTIPTGQDRITIRGFQTDGQRVDNFSSYAQINLDPIFLDRVEVVKGPNAILAPSGIPGGTINNVTRKPQYRDFASASVEVGLFSAQRFEFDVNRVFGASQSFAFRMVGAVEDTKGYADDKRRYVAFMPEISYRNKGGMEFTLQFAETNSRVQNWFGMPIDPSSGTTTDAKILSGVPRDFNYSDNDYRFERRPELRAFLTLPLVENLSMRVAARFNDYNTGFLQDLAAAPAGTTGGAINPLTGLYTPGFVYGPTPTFTPSVATPFVRTLPRSGTKNDDNWKYLNLQNDFAYNFKRDWLNSQTLAGFALNRLFHKASIVNTTAPAINFDAPVHTGYTLGVLSQRIDTTNYDEQVYLAETLSFFKERLILNGSYSYNNYDLQDRDLLKSITYNTSIDTELKSYGALVKIIPQVAAYYSYSQNSTPTSAFAIGAQSAKPLQAGEQNEYGLRVNLFQSKLTASVAYFKITQNNYSVPNPANYVFPPPATPLPNLFSDRLAKGWEFEARATINTELSVIGNFTTFTNRDPNDVPFRNTAEKSGAVLVNYQFEKSSVLSNFSAGVGVTYLSKRPGDSASGVTAASVSTAIIPNLPSFYIPERTLVNLNLGYHLNKHWSAQVNLDNVLNKDYIASSITRYVVVPGDPFNARLRVTYSF